MICFGVGVFPVARSVLAYGKIIATEGCRKASFLLKTTLVSITVVLGGCSLTMPFEGSRSSAVQASEDITGSIGSQKSKPKDLEPGSVSAFFPKMDDEDLRRANAALGTALDPQGNGGLVRWDNTESHAKGSFAPIGNAFLVKDDICRTFVSMSSFNGPEDWHQGSACRVAPGAWQIRDMKPWKKPA
jgi:surface antigen